MIVYQQIENYFLSPRLTARTMDLHPAVAFAAALIGGALGGILFAFLALPVAGVMQAAMREYSKRYEVVDDERIGEPDTMKLSKPGLMERFRERPPGGG